MTLIAARCPRCATWARYVATRTPSGLWLYCTWCARWVLLVPSPLSGEREPPGDAKPPS